MKQTQRISVTVSKSLGVTIGDIARLTKQSQSRLIGELLESMHGVFVGLEKALSAAAALKENAKGALRAGGTLNDLKKAQERIGAALGVVNEEASKLGASLQGRLGAVRSGSGRSPVAAPKGRGKRR